MIHAGHFGSVGKKFGSKINDPRSFFNHEVPGSNPGALTTKIRGRIGFTPLAPLLIDATGGFAYGEVTSNTSLARASYSDGALAQLNSAGTPFVTIGVVSRADLSGEIVRVGVNYKFDLLAPHAR